MIYGAGGHLQRIGGAGDGPVKGRESRKLIAPTEAGAMNQGAKFSTSFREVVMRRNKSLAYGTRNCRKKRRSMRL
jgi:hypothetical protein